MNDVLFDDLIFLYFFELFHTESLKMKFRFYDIFFFNNHFNDSLLNFIHRTEKEKEIRRKEKALKVIRLKFILFVIQ